MQKGDFSRDGISGLLSFAYTNSYIHYGPIAAGASGSTVLGADQQLDRAVQRLYEILRDASERSEHDVRRQHVKRHDGQRVLHAGGNAGRRRFPAAAVRTAISPTLTGTRPHKRWSIRARTFPTFDTFPGALGLSRSGIRLAVRRDAAAQLQASEIRNHAVIAVPRRRQIWHPDLRGRHRPSEHTVVGINRLRETALRRPLQCLDLSQTSSPSRIRLRVPSIALGAFTQPNELIANLQLSYDVSPRIQLVGQLTNIVNYCWGGSKDAVDVQRRQHLRVRKHHERTRRYGLPRRTVRNAGRDRQPAGLSGFANPTVPEVPLRAAFGPATRCSDERLEQGSDSSSTSRQISDCKRSRA